MSVLVPCPRCGTPVRVEERMLNTDVSCPQCQTNFLATPSSDSSQPSGMATAAMVLGIIGMIAWCIPLLGLPVNLTGLILGCLSLKASNKGMALTGVILSGIGLVLTIGYFVVSFILIMNRQR